MLHKGLVLLQPGGGGGGGLGGLFGLLYERHERIFCGLFKERTTGDNYFCNTAGSILHGNITAIPVEDLLRAVMSALR